jgi:3-phenylpropionate/trans-cinnamate dioxygenase ferredoxin component
MHRETRVGPASDIPPGTVVGAGRWAVGNVDGEFFAVSRRCRHLFADLAQGKIDRNGCLVCPWHASAYDVETGRMVRGPQGIFAKIPGLDPAYIAFTKVLPLARGRVEVRDGVVYVR